MRADDRRRFPRSSDPSPTTSLATSGSGRYRESGRTSARFTSTFDDESFWYSEFFAQDSLGLASSLLIAVARDTHTRLGDDPLFWGSSDVYEQAREHLTAATPMYRNMGMTFWLEEADAELKSIN